MNEKTLDAYVLEKLEKAERLAEMWKDSSMFWKELVLQHGLNLEPKELEKKMREAAEHGIIT